MTDDHRKRADKKMSGKKMSGAFLRGDPRAASSQGCLTSLLALTALGAVVAIGAAFRLVDLPNRPMHCDEAVHAIKFGQLLEDDNYVYDPKEYHGPSLNYLTLPITYLTGKEKLTEVSETDLRLLPALFGIALIGLVWLLRSELGTAAILWAAVFTAVSPAMVFYGRYYIQEMLLVVFTFGAMIAAVKALKRVCGPRADGVHLVAVRDEIQEGGNIFLTDAAESGFVSFVQGAIWLPTLGVCLGMMHASKETCVIAMFCLAVAAVVYVVQLRQGHPASSRRHRRRPCLSALPLVSAFVVILVAAGVSMLFFSSFLANPGGIADSLTTYFVYLGRSSGEGSVGRHVYPWSYYLSHLFWFHRDEGPVWTELSIAILALVGSIAGALGKGFDKQTAHAHVPMVRLLGIYTVLMTVVYCALPYKTPWCALGFLHGMILLAGVGAAVLMRVAPGRISKSVIALLLAAAVGHLAWQAYRASFVAFEDPTNPYVYSQTTNDVPDLCKRVEEIAESYARLRAEEVIKQRIDDFIDMQLDERTNLRAQRQAEESVEPREELFRMIDRLNRLKEIDGKIDKLNGQLDAKAIQERRESLLKEEIGKSGRHTMYIQVLCPDDDFWPLPWYLRHFTKVGCFVKTPKGPPAPLIILQPVMADLFLRYNYGQPPGQRYAYVPFPHEKDDPPWQLRPHVPLEIYMRLDLHEKYVAAKEELAAELAPR